ncbi:MAG: radical SAM protein [Candidatus Nanoarchaeia archaeon]|nr:radical SAM protein [Candidatus Nanoarchaeia archaeon]
MKILLIKPQITISKNFKGIGRFFPPIGLEYIAALLEQNNYTVKILDTSIEDWKKIHKRTDGMEYMGMSFDKVKKEIKKENPDVVGITTLTVDSVNAFSIVKAIKEVNPLIKVIFGGPHVCAMPEEVINNSNVDVICIGEGEYTFLELMQEFEKKNLNLTKVKGIWYKENGKIIKNELRPLIQDLDKLPFPARHLINYEKYAEAGKYLQGSRRVETRRDTIISSRGCPFNCIFCTISISMGKQFRARSPENVIKEIEEIIEKYNVGDIGFEDDNFTFNKERTNKILDLIIKKGLNKKISWSTPNGVRADTLDENLLKKMKEAGCEEIIFAPESGNQFVVNNIIKKKLDLRIVERNAKICKEIGLRCGMFFVIGSPGETKEQINDTVNFANKMKKEYNVFPMLFTAQPYYNTDLYKISKEKGYLTKTNKASFEQGLINEEAMIKTSEFTPEYLAKIRSEFSASIDKMGIFELIKSRPFDSLRAFLLHPKYIIKHLSKLLYSKFT